MMDCKFQVGFKVSLFVSHLLALFCPVFFKGWIYCTVSVKSTASSNYNIVIVLTIVAKIQKTQQTKGGNEEKARKGEPVEREPPTGSPKWALSDEWREIMQRREQEQTEM